MARASGASAGPRNTRENGARWPSAGMFSRAVVVLDENNTVVHREQIPDIGNEPDYTATYRALGIKVDPSDLEVTF